MRAGSGPRTSRQPPELSRCHARNVARWVAHRFDVTVMSCRTRGATPIRSGNARAAYAEVPADLIDGPMRFDMSPPTAGVSTTARSNNADNAPVVSRCERMRWVRARMSATFERGFLLGNERV